MPAPEVIDRADGSRRLPRLWADASSAAVRVPPRRLAVAVLAVVIMGYGALAVVGTLFAGDTPGRAAAGVVLAVALTALQCYVSRPSRVPRAPWSHLALLAQAAIVFTALLVLGPKWQGLPGFLVGSILITLPLRVGAPVATAAVVAIVLASGADAPIASPIGTAFAVTYAVTSTLTAGFAVFGLTRLVRLAVEAHDVHRELRRIAVAEERLRFARTMHRQLGQSLSALVLRAQLVDRLVETAPVRAGEEFVGLLDLTREALRDMRRVAGVRDVPPPDPPAPTSAVAMGGPPFGGLMLGAVVLNFAIVAVGGLALTVPDPRPLVGLAVMVVIAGLAAVALGPGHRLADGPAAAVLLMLAAAVYAPMAYLGPLWHGMPALVGGAALVLLRPAPAVATSVVVWASAVVVELLEPAPTLSLAYSLTYMAVGVVVASLIFYGLAIVPRLVSDIVDTRADLDRLAVAQERVRLSRDLHDMLGFSLSTLALKCELGARLLAQDPAQARAELEEALGAARQALAESRRVGSEHPLALLEERRVVEQTLGLADVDVRVRWEAETPAEPMATVLATVLREGATNILRHSDARVCDVHLSRQDDVVTLEMTNDGATREGHRPTDGEDEDGGYGLRNLLDRVEAVGGRITAGHGAGDRFHLRTTVPAGPVVDRRPEDSVQPDTT